jgi:hypothetical protein
MTYGPARRLDSRSQRPNHIIRNIRREDEVKEMPFQQRLARLTRALKTRLQLEIKLSLSVSILKTIGHSIYNAIRF